MYRRLSVLLLVVAATAAPVAQSGQRVAAHRPPDPRRTVELHRNQPLRRCAAVPGDGGPGVGPRPPDVVRLHVRGPVAAAGGGGPRRRRHAGGGPRVRAPARLPPGQHPCAGRSKARKRCWRSSATSPRGAHADWLQSMVLLVEPDLQRRRQRARDAHQPRFSARSDRRPGHAARMRRASTSTATTSSSRRPKRVRWCGC